MNSPDCNAQASEPIGFCRFRIGARGRASGIPRKAFGDGYVLLRQIGRHTAALGAIPAERAELPVHGGC